MQLVTLDFETYYDDEYTLKKLTTEEYIRDPRFKVHCVGTKDEEWGTMIASHQVQDLNEWIDGHAVLCHHAHFDGLILSHHYSIRPKFWFDTLSMARLVLPHLKSHSLESLAEHFNLGVKTVPYNLFKGNRGLDYETQRLLEEGCKHDVELTYEIFKRLLPHVSKEELRVIDLTIRMYTEPMLQLDEERANDYLQKTLEEKASLLEKCGVTESELSSSKRFAECLSLLGVEPPLKVSPRTGKETYALAKTDAGFKELCESPNDTVAILCAARLGVKSTLAETRTGRLLGCSNRGNLPVYLKYYGAHTGRWSGGDKVNWQNFPRGGEIRKSILAPEGYVLVVADLSQIECRMLNWLAGQEDVLDAFRAGRDLYCEAASRFYGRTITKNDKSERHIFKSVELGCGYGMGHKKFREYARQAGNTVSEAEAKGLIDFYRGTHNMVTRYWKKMDRVIEELNAHILMTQEHGAFYVHGERIIYPNGGYQVFEGLSKKQGGELDNPRFEWIYTLRGREQKVYGGLLTENVTQALSRILLSQAMLKISERYKVVLTEHDSCGWLAKIEESEEALAFGMKILTTNPEWCIDLPLACEGGYARNYSK